MSEVNNTDLDALHSKISDHVKNKTPLYLTDPEVDLLDSALTIRYNLIDIFNRLRCSVPEMPGEGATDDEQKEIEKLQPILQEYKGHASYHSRELKLTGKQTEVTLKALSTAASKRILDGENKSNGGK